VDYVDVKNDGRRDAKGDAVSVDEVMGGGGDEALAEMSLHSY